MYFTAVSVFLLPVSQMFTRSFFFYYKICTTVGVRKCYSSSFKSHIIGERALLMYVVK